jgi:hypothetical protein
MSFFSFIETFFFLTLGVTFVLILLLVYHFKQRLSALESKCDTVFELISNIVKELAVVRQTQNNNMVHQLNMGTFNVEDMRELTRMVHPSMSPNEVVEKIKVLEEDFDEDEEESSEDEDSEEGSDDGSEDSGEPSEYDDMPPLINGTFEVDDDVPSNIKIVNVPISENIEDYIEPVELDQDIADSENNDQLEPVELQEQEETIHVEKLEEVESLENNEESNDSQKDSKEVYNKMSVSELKALVITKGLSSDPSKKKKNELIKLLETTEN